MSLTADTSVQFDEPNPTDNWFRKYAGAAAEGILAFCERNAIVNELKNGVSLAEKCFGPSVIHLEEEVDPETDDRKIVISLTIRNKSREEILASYRAYTNQSVKVMPWPKSSFIRLSYDIL